MNTISVKQSYGNATTSHGGASANGNVSNFHICGAEIKKRYYLPIIVLALVAIVVPVTIVKFAPLPKQSIHNNPITPNTIPSNSAIDELAGSTTSTIPLPTRISTGISTSSGTEALATSHISSSSSASCWAYPTACSNVQCPGQLCEQDQDCKSPYPCIAADDGSSSSVCASYGLLKDGSTTSICPCWAYPTACANVQCPGQPCEQDQDCKSPYPCIAADDGSSSSVCASYGLLRDGSTTSICPN